ncbi:MAG: class I SAM-dependent methyltransferase [Proteobacteria bacterium]|nr:MAG: class I SAM-dependent methyltransferase [Pseudomonadota bacterium]
MSKLISVNSLEDDGNGIFSHPDSAERDFAYSDGDAAERYLHDVLKNATDLSSDSEELQLAIRDWPSEYHLSPRRANLLRPLPIERGARVLELGCGCGAITRYLGEAGCDVDAVEGSAVRARLARMRCQELDNVSVVQANFNRLSLPRHEYDYALLIGVAEYARRFSPSAGSDRDAVVDLLTRIHGSLKPGGRLLVAIENRAGMKYLHGAHEDHYSLRFVGIDDYSEPAGIRTYTRREWRGIADDTGFSHQVVLYPFPDYKIPTVYLGETYCERDANAWCHLEGIDSTDYTFLFDPYIPETLTWQGYNAAGVLGDMANSFMLVLSDADNLGDFAAMEFCHLPDFRRKRTHCTVVSKTRDDDMVRRYSIGLGGDAGKEISHERYIEGVLLSALWARSIMIHPDPSRFHARLREYAAFVEDRASRQPLPIDLLPNNIVVDAHGAYRVFDQEWDGDAVDSDYLLFRALLTFANHHHAAIRQFARRYELYTVGGFIRHAFRVLGRANRTAEEFCEREDAFQQRVLLERTEDTAALLAAPIAENAIRAFLYPRLAWSDSERFDDDHEIIRTLSPGPAPVMLEYSLPPEVRALRHLRFRPCDENRPQDHGFFNIDAIHVLSVGAGNRDDTLWSLDGEEIVLNKAELSQVGLVQAGAERMLGATGDRPTLTFSPRVSLASDDSRFVVRISLRYSQTRDYRLARQDFLAKEADLRQRIAALERSLEHARRAEGELERIKSSPTWRLLTALRRRIPGGRRGA